MRKENGLLIYGDQKDEDNIYWGHEGIVANVLFFNDYDAKYIELVEVQYLREQGIYKPHGIQRILLDNTISLSTVEDIINLIKKELTKFFPEIVDFGFPEIAIKEKDLNYLLNW